MRSFLEIDFLKIRLLFQKRFFMPSGESITLYNPPLNMKVTNVYFGISESQKLRTAWPNRSALKDVKLMRVR